MVIIHCLSTYVIAMVTSPIFCLLMSALWYLTPHSVFLCPRHGNQPLFLFPCVNAMVISPTTSPQVHLCEALQADELMVDELMLNRSLPRTPLLVAVKMLRPNADDRAR